MANQRRGQRRVCTHHDPDLEDRRKNPGRRATDTTSPEERILEDCCIQCMYLRGEAKACESCLGMLPRHGPVHVADYSEAEFRILEEFAQMGPCEHCGAPILSGDESVELAIRETDAEGEYTGEAIIASGVSTERLRQIGLALQRFAVATKHAARAERS